MVGPKQVSIQAQFPTPHRMFAIAPWSAAATLPRECHGRMKAFARNRDRYFCSPIIRFRLTIFLRDKKWSRDQF